MRMEFEGGVASLTITHLELAHEGTYECAAQSYAGSAGATASLSVKGKGEEICVGKKAKGI